MKLLLVLLLLNATLLAQIMIRGPVPVLTAAETFTESLEYWDYMDRSSTWVDKSEYWDYQDTLQ